MVAQQAVQDAEQVLKAARAKTIGDHSLSEREERARDSMQQARGNLVSAIAQEETAAKHVGENRQIKEELMKLMDHNVDQAQGRFTKAHDEVEAARHRVSEAHEAHEATVIAKKQKKEEIKGERMKAASEEAAK